MKTFELKGGFGGLLGGGLLMGDEDVLAGVGYEVAYAVSFAIDEEGKTADPDELPVKPWAEVYEKGTLPLRELCNRGEVFFESLEPSLFHCRLEEETPGQPPLEGVSEVVRGFLHLPTGRLCVAEAGFFSEAAEEAAASPLAMLEVAPGGYEVSVLHLARMKERRTRGVFGDAQRPALVLRVRRLEDGQPPEDLLAGNFTRKRRAWLESWNRDSDVIVGTALEWRPSWQPSTSWKPGAPRRGPRLLS